MGQIDLLQKAVDYIEDHIKENIIPEELAKKSGYSPFHFYRMFQKTMGYSVMDYVLKRKLQYALHDLVHGRKVLDIAVDYGFETHAGFTKAFKKCFGSPPSLYKRHCPSSLPQKLHVISLHQKQTGGMVLQPKIMERPAFYVAGKTFESQVENITFTRDAPAFWEERGLTDGTIERYLYQTLSPKTHGEYCINISTPKLEERFIYFFAVSYEEHVLLPNDITKLLIPASTYAVFKTPLVSKEQFAPSIKGTWKYILEDWLPYSNYEIDENGYDFEYYDEHCHYWDFEKIYMEIHIPIKPKEKE